MKKLDFSRIYMAGSIYANGRWILPYLGVSVDGEIWIDDADMGDSAMTFDEYHKIDRSIPLWREGYDGYELISPASLEQALESVEGQRLLEAVFDGADKEWDGNNYVGVWDEDAFLDLAEFIRDCEYQRWEVWGADEWMGNLSDEELLAYAELQPTATADDIRAAAVVIEEDASEPGIIRVIENVECYLEMRLQEMVSDD